MLKILALDQATHCGWATEGASGVWDLSTKKDETIGIKLLRFKKKLSNFHKVRKFDVIAYERVAGMHKSSIIHAAKLVAMIETFCEENSIEYIAYSAKDIKKSATGNGNANKEKMVLAAKEKYNMPGNDDNQADALHIYHLAKNNLQS